MDLTGAVCPWCGDPCATTPQVPDFSRLSFRVAEREAYIVAAQTVQRDTQEGAQ